MITKSVHTAIEDLDQAEQDRISKFLVETCHCSMDKGSPCSNSFSKEDITIMRACCMGMSHSSLDMIIMGQIMAHTVKCTLSSHARSASNRVRLSTNYYHHGIKVL